MESNSNVGGEYVAAEEGGSAPKEKVSNFNHTSDLLDLLRGIRRTFRC